MTRPLSLDDDDDLNSPPPPPKPTRSRPAVADDDELAPPPRSRRTPGGTGMMPAGSPVAVVIVLVMAVGMVAAAAAGVSMIASWKSSQKAGPEVVSQPPAPQPEPDAASTPETGSKPANETPKAKVPGEKLAAGVLPISLPADRVTRMVFSGGEAGHAAIVTTKPRGTGRMVYILNTATGATVGRLSLETETDAGFAVSPDGNVFAVLDSGGPNGRSIALYRVETGNLITRITPYESAAAGSALDIVFLAFTARDSFLTITVNGQIDVWSAVPFQRTASQNLDLPVSSGIQLDAATGCPKNFALSADGKTLAAFTGFGFAFFATDTLRRLSTTEDIATADVRMTFSGAALSADGSKFACYFQTSGSRSRVAVEVWETRTGRRESTPALPSFVPPSGFAWWGPDHILFLKSGLAACDVVNVKSMKIVGSLKAPLLNKLCPQAPSDAAWAVVSGETDRAYLVRAAIPASLAAEAHFELNATGLQPIK